MEPFNCRVLLERLLNEEVAALTELEPLLIREHDLLAANDIDGLETAGDARQHCVGRLVRIEDERRGLCRMVEGGDAADERATERLLAWCDPQRTLLSRWQDCAERATRCRAQNEKNGMLVAARLRHVEGMLTMLDAAGRDSRTYGPRGGDSSTSPAPGRMLSTSA